MTIRSFLAFPISSELKESLRHVLNDLQQTRADVKWVPRENLHFTLKFLGDVPATETSQVCDAVAAAVAELPAFELEVRSVGAFPSIHRPRTLWLGAGVGAEELTRVQRHIQIALKKLRYPPEGRKFTPHLTIGRVRSGGPALADLARALSQHADDVLGRARVEEAIVFASQLSSAGSAYTVLGRAPLRATS